jgi:hypothetical protein
MTSIPPKPDMTIAQWCARHQVSETKYHSLRKQGLGPRELVLGVRSIRITEKADAEWQQMMAEHAASRAGRRERQRQLELARAGGRAAVASPKHRNNRVRGRGRP